MVSVLNSKHKSIWDKLSLTLEDLQQIQSISDMGCKEELILNLLVRNYNKAFNQGKKIVLDEITKW